MLQFYKLRSILFSQILRNDNLILNNLAKQKQKKLNSVKIF